MGQRRIRKLCFVPATFQQKIDKAAVVSRASPQVADVDAVNDHFYDGGFVKKKMIGEGGNAAVFLAVCGEQKYAMKEILAPVDKCGRPRPLRVLKEAAIMDRFGDPNIAKCVCATISDDYSQVRIFMELARYGDLHSFVEKRGYLHPKTAQLFVDQIVSGLRVIHNAGYAHRDIKPNNVLVFGLRDVQITDFGVAKKLGSNDSVRADVGTPFFYPPEATLCCGGDVDGVAWDLWGASITHVYCLLGKYPWDEASMADPEYAAFQCGDFRSLVKIDRRWMRVKMDFWYLRQLLRHDPMKRKYPFSY